MLGFKDHFTMGPAASIDGKQSMVYRQMTLPLLVCNFNPILKIVLNLVS